MAAGTDRSHLPARNHCIERSGQKAPGRSRCPLTAMKLSRWQSRFMDRQPGGWVLELERVLNAHSQQIFSALTEPSQLAEWWGPHGFTTPEIELDLAVGGGYRFTMQPPDGDSFHLSGEFREIESPSRLVYTFRWEEPDPDDRETVVKLTLRAVGDATKVVLSQGEFATEARLALHRSGWADSLEKLRQLIESGTQHSDSDGRQPHSGK